jgi:TonB-linked SusC/RagA family outer membrane protein
VPFEEALRQIQDLTNVKFFYSPAQLADEASVNMQVDGWTLGEVLEGLLKPRRIEYKVHEKEATITLRKIKVDEPGPIKDGPTTDRKHRVLIEVTGTVTDSDGQPMAGVNVVVKGTTVGTSTDVTGKYSINAQIGDILVFSFIGYATVEQTVGEAPVLNVTLKEDIRSLEEVTVNAGYYTTTKASQTGSIAKITFEEIEKQPVSNPLAALQARVPGLEIVQQNGVPGGNFEVRIRGTNSISNGNDPLYIVDGVPFFSTSLSGTSTSGQLYLDGYSPFNSINPSDIESIEILKDADATAIYGSRGANGVILITTKKGKKGMPRVNLNAYTAFAKISRKMDLLTTDEYRKMRREAFKNDGTIPNMVNAPDLMLWDSVRYTDWQDVLIGETARTHDIQLSISGGGEQITFLMGAAYHRETTVFPGDHSDQRINAHVNVSSNSHNGKLQMSTSIEYSSGITDLLQLDLTTHALTLPPNAPELYDNNGNLNWESGSFLNPLSHLEKAYDALASYLMANSTVKYSITPSLTLKSSFGFANVSRDEMATTPLSAYDPSIRQYLKSELRLSNSSFRNWVVEPQVNWVKEVGSSRLEALVGATFLDQKTESFAQLGRGFSSDALIKDIKAASEYDVLESSSTNYRYSAIFARIYYAWKDKYLINVTGRRDGSSRFGPGKQFANFGAVGTAWIFSKEDFVSRGIPFLSFGKIRASYGLTGNDQLSDYEYLDTYTTSGTYQGITALTPVRLSNPEFGWETNRKFELGLELRFLDDRIAIETAYYANTSSNQLVGFPLPPTAGFPSIQGNLAATIQNTGWETSVEIASIKSNNFLWSTFINLTVPRNKLISFPNLESSPEYRNRLVVGEPLTIRKQYSFTGVDPTTGIYQFEDVDGNGSLNTSDRQSIIFTGRDFYGGISNVFQYRGFELGFLLEFVSQGGIKYRTSFAPGLKGNQPSSVMSRWISEGDITDTQKFTSSFGTAFTAYDRSASSDRILTDASFIRLKNLHLSYTVPERFVNKVPIYTAQVFIQGQNLATVTSYDGMDPETQGSTLPPLRVISAGIRLTF